MISVVIVVVSIPSTALALSMTTLDPNAISDVGLPLEVTAGRPIGASGNGYTRLDDRFQYLSVNDP